MAAYVGYTRNAVALWAFCALTLISSAPDGLGTARPIDGRTVKEVKVDDEKLDAFPELCYLGDMISAGDGCELAVVTRCKCAWGKVRQLLPLLTNGNLPLLLLFTCNYVVSVWRGFLFLLVLGMGYVILLWDSLSLPYNYYA